MTEAATISETTHQQLERFELQTAAKIWEALSAEDRQRLLSLPIAKEHEVEWDDKAGGKIRGSVKEWNDWLVADASPSCGGAFRTNKTFDDPDFLNLIRLGLALDGFCVETIYSSMSFAPAQGYPYHTAAYIASPFGSIVARIGYAKRLLELALGQEE